jgi:hypothetical protein
MIFQLVITYVLCCLFWVEMLTFVFQGVLLGVSSFPLT